jgi:hypothetical protein
MLHYRNIYLTDLLVGVGITSSERSGCSALRGKLGARRNLWIVCVAPLWHGGLRGKKSTPNLGWEVPVKSQRSTSSSHMERVDATQSGGSGNGTPFYNRCCRFYDWIYILIM